MLRVRSDRSKLLKCIDRTFSLTEQAVHEEKLKRACLEREHASLEKEMEAIRMMNYYKTKLEECESPCIERTWANDLKQVITFMEQKQKQKQVYKDDWKDASRMLVDIVARLKEVPKKVVSRRKTQKKRQ